MSAGYSLVRDKAVEDLTRTGQAFCQPSDAGAEGKRKKPVSGVESDGEELLFPAKLERLTSSMCPNGDGRLPPDMVL